MCVCLRVCSHGVSFTRIPTHIVRTNRCDKDLRIVRPIVFSGNLDSKSVLCKTTLVAFAYLCVFYASLTLITKVDLDDRVGIGNKKLCH